MTHTRFVSVLLLITLVCLAQQGVAESQSLTQETAKETTLEANQERLNRNTDVNQSQIKDKPEYIEKKAFSFLRADKPQPETTTNSSDALSVSLGLIVILGLIFSLAWLMRKMGYSHVSGQGQLKLLATMNLGQKEKIALIQVGQQQLLVGITTSQINTLHVLDESLKTTESSSDDQQSDSRENSPANPFAQKLADTLSVIKTK
jgi:flagellar biosynthetic protein FliO